MKASFTKHTLKFKQASGTSRGVLRVKDSYFIQITDGEKLGIGECGLLKGLSVDPIEDYEVKLQWTCDHITKGLSYLYPLLYNYPSIQFGLEQAFMSLDSNTAYNLFPSDFTKGKQHIPINGLVWMGDKAFMKKQLEEKLASGYSCIKLKIGAIDFETELELLQFIRNNYSSQEIEIRVDANGAFHSTAALEKLKRLAEFELHSIEQPIKQGQLHEMASLCETSPIPIALDEELIGVVSQAEKSKLISTIKPQYIILKPSLIGGFKSATDWINIAKLNNVGWWVTSALESNIGLNAIAQWTATLNNNMPQGLGTGALYTNNFNSPLVAENGILRFDTNANWQVNLNF